MFSKKYFLLAASFLSVQELFSRGRPWDNPDYHESSFSYVIGVIVLIGVLAIGFLWLLDKISRNKEEIKNVLGMLLVGLGIPGAIIFLIGTCASSSESDKKSKSAESPSISVPANSAPPKEEFSTLQYNEPAQSHTPTLKYRTVEKLEDCPICNGTGKVVCSKCRGTGWIAEKCEFCNGTGGHRTTTCDRCFGKGYTEDFMGYDKTRYACIRCDGTGRVEDYCHSCSGSGIYRRSCSGGGLSLLNSDGTHYVKCERCNGNGMIMQTIQESYYE